MRYIRSCAIWLSEEPEAMYHTTADVVKIFMSTLVVMIHTSYFSLLRLEQLAVPVFFVYSGYYLYERVLGAGSDSEKKDIFKRYIKKMIYLYVVCEAVYSPFMLESLLSEGVSLKNAALYIRNYVFVGEQAFSWHLWYLLAAIYGGAILMLFARASRGLFILCGLCTILFVSDHLFHYIESCRLHTLLFKYPFPRLSTGLWLMSAGGCLSARKSIFKRREWIALLFIALMCLINLFPSSEFYLIPIASAFLVVVSLHYELPIPKSTSRTIRKASTFIYMAHMLFVAVLLKYSSIGYGFTLWALVLLASVAAFYLFNDTFHYHPGI